jgi:hypothetical protein
MLRAGRDPAELAAGTVIRELYHLPSDPGEQRTLIPPGDLRETWPRFPCAITSEGAREIARDLEAKLDGWIAETMAAGQNVRC